MIKVNPILIFLFVVQLESLPVVVQKYEYDNDGSGNYTYKLHLKDERSSINNNTNIVIVNLVNEETGKVNDNSKSGIIKFSLENNTYYYRMNYTADERGFRPSVKWSLHRDGAENPDKIGTALLTTLGGR